ncbi:3-hydroxyisobutyryl-CoA hydrolase 3 [Artemisia annua]|uniref:3-hydroxyisobutyryl-CoA hydrolase 3 n=1 Tax=Artemisia annua TaxID=35608 RepID=A0A2U1MJ27_ARTAN|nr:3-hydroxyisobutyryl-CoA hydrolase 3 [Artemisia annua]
MGGGAGASMHGRFRVATDNTNFSMPDASLGYFQMWVPLISYRDCMDSLGLAVHSETSKMKREIPKVCSVYLRHKDIEHVRATEEVHSQNYMTKFAGLLFGNAVKGGKCVTGWMKVRLGCFATQWISVYNARRPMKQRWGLARHFHYVPEIMAAILWTIPALFDNKVLSGSYWGKF